MDQIGLYRPGTNIASVRSKGNSVLIDLKTPDSQFIAANLNGIAIVPQHIWSKVADPATFTNPKPVGSGPFNQVGRFTTQDYVLNKNPHYWIPGAPKIPCPRAAASVVAWTEKLASRSSPPSTIRKSE